MFAISKSKRVIFPCCGFIRPAAKSIKVDFPLPFGPIKLVKEPGSSAVKKSKIGFGKIGLPFSSVSISPFTGG